MDILSEINTLKADLQAAQTLLDEAKNAKITFDSTLAAKDSEIAAKESALKAAQALAAGKDSELETLRAEITALKANQKSANEAAIEIVASQGIAPIATKPEDPISEAPTRTQALAKYGTLTGQEKADYYKAHRTLLTGK